MLVIGGLFKVNPLYSRRNNMKKLLFAYLLVPAYADYQIYTHGGAGDRQWNINIAKMLSTVTQTLTYCTLKVLEKQ